MDITGLSKAAVLAALFNAARGPRVAALFNPGGAQPMSEADAEQVWAAKVMQEQLTEGDEVYFDYLRGRVMKIALDSDRLDTRLYNRDNGPDAAEQAIAHLRKP